MGRDIYLDLDLVCSLAKGFFKPSAVEFAIFFITITTFSFIFCQSWIRLAQVLYTNYWMLHLFISQGLHGDIYNNVLYCWNESIVFAFTFAWGIHPWSLYFFFPSKTFFFPPFKWKCVMTNIIVFSRLSF